MSGGYNPSPEGNPSVLARRNWLQTRLVILLGKLTPTCREVVRILSTSMEAPLPLSTRIKLRLHYLICVWCQRYELQLREMRKYLSKLPEHVDDCCLDVLSDATKQRMKEALRGEAPPERRKPDPH